MLYVDAKLRLSMIHRLITVEGTMAISLPRAESQKLVLGWPSTGGFEAGGFAVSCSASAAVGRVFNPSDSQRTVLGVTSWFGP